MSHLVYHTISSIPLPSPFEDAIGRIASSGQIRVVSPYIDVEYIKRVVSIASDWKLVSDVEEWLCSLSIRTRAAAWQFIRQNGDRIHHCTALHAKAVIGKSTALIGSANLTRSGLARREEMSIYLDEPPLVRELHKWFDSLWRDTGQPLADETNALVQWLDQEASDSPSRRERFALSRTARRIRSYLLSQAAEAPKEAGGTSLDTLHLAALAETLVVREQRRYDSLAQVVSASIDVRIDSGVFSFGDVLRDSRAAFPSARSREVLFLLLQRCANHARSAFVETTENHLVLVDVRFRKSTRADVLAVVAPFDTFLDYLIRQLTFDATRPLPLEAQVQHATGFDGRVQTILTAELVESGFLTMDDIAGELPRYALQPGFDWEGRFQIFGRALGAWTAMKLSSAPTAVSTGRDAADELDDLVEGQLDGAPSPFDRAWAAIVAERAKPKPPGERTPSMDGALAALLSVLFAGEMLQAETIEALQEAICRRVGLSRSAVELLLNGTANRTKILRIVTADDGAVHRLDVNPELTWRSLAAYPKTQRVCERFLGMERTAPGKAK